MGAGGEWNDQRFEDNRGHGFISFDGWRWVEVELCGHYAREYPRPGHHNWSSTGEQRLHRLPLVPDRVDSGTVRPGRLRERPGSREGRQGPPQQPDGRLLIIAIMRLKDTRKIAIIRIEGDRACRKQKWSCSQKTNGSVPLLKWLDAQPAKVQDKCIVRVERLAEMGHGLRRPEADYLRNGIYELRAGRLRSSLPNALFLQPRLRRPISRTDQRR